MVFTTLDILQSEKLMICESIFSANPFYLRVDHVNGYIEEKGVNKYLAFDPTYEKKELIMII